MIEPQIIFEDQVLLVLNKPAGLVVNRAETTAQFTLQDWLEKKFNPVAAGQNLKFRISCRSGIVHRLDKDTSGLIVVAKTESAFTNLQLQFKQRSVEKKYLALVHGEVKPKQGVVRASVGRNPFNRKKFGVFLGGKEAETEYQVLRYYDSHLGKFSYLEMRPKTGRTHQIRVHLKHIGHPVVGDDFYAGRKTARADRRWCPRQFLHASFLSFYQPVSGQRLTLTSPLPVDLQTALKQFKPI